MATRKTKPLRPMPEEFPSLARNITIKEASRRFRAGGRTVKRWFAELGIVPVSQIVIANRAMGATPWLAPRDGSPESQAADHLRRLRYANVHRCDEKGRFKLKGKYWIAGTRFFTPEELVDHARAKGWEPDEWRRVLAA